MNFDIECLPDGMRDAIDKNASDIRDAMDDLILSDLVVARDYHPHYSNIINRINSIQPIDSIDGDVFNFTFNGASTELIDDCLMDDDTTKDDEKFNERCGIDHLNMK